MQLEFSRFVENDLDDIASYIAQDSPRRAVAFIQKIRAAFYDIQKNPQHHRLRPEIGEGARMAVVGRYIILFRIVGEKVRIERVVFGGRDLHNLPF